MSDETTRPMHLRSATSSLVLGVALPRPGAGSGPGAGQPATGQALPEVLHWGAPLPADVDLDDVALAVGRPTPHSNPDVPRRRPYAPQGVDAWPLRPTLTGSRADGTGFAPCFELVAASTPSTSGTPGEIVLVARDTTTELTLTTRVALDAHGVLTLAHEVRNDGEETYLLGGLAASLPLPMRATEVLDLTGRWCRERSPQRHTLGFGTWSREARHGRTGHDASLLLHVGAPGFEFGRGEVWAVHLAWSGDSILFAERDPSGFAQVGAGELLAPGEVRLGPGEAYAGPVLHAAYSEDGGMDAISGAFHAHLRARESHPRGPRKVVLNTWEAVYFDHDLGRLTALADAAADVGVERFVLDDGWFGARRNDLAGLGDWVVSPDAWPDGLEPLISHVRSRGMDFGIWVEPEMVNLDSDLVRAHPEWVLAVPGRLPVPWRHQQVLDLTEAGAFAHVLGQLDALLTDHDIAFVKWDMNRDLVDTASAGRGVVHAQTLALYRLLDELRVRHPSVEIETCASGGGRVDLGILARTDRLWASDTIDAHERQHIQRWTGSLVPPELVGSHVGSGAAHTTGRRHTIAFRAATALFGHFGVEADLTALDDETLAALGGGIAAYRRLRDLLHSGTVVRLDDAPEGSLQHGVVAADRSAAVFAHVQLVSAPTEVSGVLRTRGLDPGARYRVVPLDIAGGATTQQTADPAWVWANEWRDVVVSGAVLERVGLALPVLHPETAFVVELRRV